jgi:transposase
MRHPVPPIREDETTLKQRLHHAHDSQKKPRLHMLHLLATRQAQDRQDVACLLGVHRNTISRWLARYAAGGLEALLATYISPGKPVSLAPAVLASLEQVLRRPEGFTSYEALRQWVAQTHGVQIKYKTRYTLVRTRFQTKLKVPRPSHTKKTLRPFQRSRLPVENASSRSSHPRTRVQSGSSARTKAASAS